MKRVRILVPFDGYAVGDTPEFTGWQARKYIADGVAAELSDHRHIPLRKKNIAQLTSLAAERGIALGDAKKRADILAVIEAALAPQA